MDTTVRTDFIWGVLPRFLFACEFLVRMRRRRAMPPLTESTHKIARSSIIRHDVARLGRSLYTICRRQRIRPTDVPFHRPAARLLGCAPAVVRSLLPLLRFLLARGARRSAVAGIFRNTHQGPRAGVALDLGAADRD